MGKKLFVGNLNFKTNDDDLRELFGQAGTVDSAMVMMDRATLSRGDAAAFQPPTGPGLVVVNPPHGERLGTAAERWRALGDLLKQRFRGWKAVVLAGGEDRGKHIGLRPRRRIPVMNGPLEARILVFDLY